MWIVDALASIWLLQLTIVAAGLAVCAWRALRSAPREPAQTEEPTLAVPAGFPPASARILSLSRALKRR